MENKEESPLKEYAKGYFKTLLAQSHPNMKFGDQLTMRIDYLDKEGNRVKVTEVTVKRDEL